MKNYLKLKLGSQNIYFDKCFNENFIGVHYDMDIDFTSKFPEKWKDFNKIYIPEYIERHPGASKIAAGLACATIWVVSHYLPTGDIVICPNNSNGFNVAEITGDYEYHQGEIFPHRRPVSWLDLEINPENLSEALLSSLNSRGTYCDITKHAEELSQLIGGLSAPRIISTDKEIEDPTAFALEKHLEEFLVQNWCKTELGKDYDIFEEGDTFGQQYPTDTGPLDILAISKDKKTLLVIELKKGRASDRVVGQIQRYMGYVKEELAESNQQVKGIIIALEDDLRIRRALSVARDIEFYRYEVRFKLLKD